MAFDIDFAEKATIQFHIKRFLLYPTYWNDNENEIPLALNWQSCEFTDANRNLIPLRKGIYCFVMKPIAPNFFETSYLFYAGKTNRTLNVRYKEYLNDQLGRGKPRPKVYEMLKIYQGYLHFYYAEIDLEGDVNICEEKLLNTFVPHINTAIPRATIKPEMKNIYEH